MASETDVRLVACVELMSHKGRLPTGRSARAHAESACLQCGSGHISIHFADASTLQPSTLYGECQTICSHGMQNGGHDTCRNMKKKAF